MSRSNRDAVSTAADEDHRAFTTSVLESATSHDRHSLIAVLIAGAHIVRGGRSITAILAIAVGLTLVVFLTSFSLSFAGYRVKADTVDAPARYSWPLVGGLTAVVMAMALYLASHFSR